MEYLHSDKKEAINYLKKYKSVRKALVALGKTIKHEIVRFQITSLSVNLRAGVTFPH